MMYEGTTVPITATGATTVSDEAKMILALYQPCINAALQRAAGLLRLLPDGPVILSSITEAYEARTRALLAALEQ